jgi:hypothetical protein
MLEDARNQEGQCKSNECIRLVAGEDDVPLDETPAPISMSGSSTTMNCSIGKPPVPPCSALSSHLRSASVSRSIGTTPMPL